VRNALTSTSRAQMEHDVGGDPEALPRRLGFAARAYEQALNAEPAGAEARWQARLYFVRPLTIAALAAFWIATGIVCLTIGRDEAIALSQAAGFSPALSPWIADIGAAFDILIGAALIISRHRKRVLALMAAATLGYLAVLTLLLPALWADPLGRMMKLIPLFALFALLGATDGER
jgi:hypothetical protein